MLTAISLIQIPVNPSLGRGNMVIREGFEWWRTAQVARDQGWTKEQTKAWENEADHYQIEDRSENRSHRWEMKPC
jgi:hypothetical protein